MKHLKKYNESYEISRDDLDNLINPISDDIRDMLVDFVGYDTKVLKNNPNPQFSFKYKGYSEKTIKIILQFLDILKINEVSKFKFNI